MSKSLAWNLFVTKLKNLSLFLDRSPAEKSRSIAGTECITTSMHAHTSEIKKTVNGSVVTWEGIYQGKPIRVRIYGEQTQEPHPKMNESS